MTAAAGLQGFRQMYSGAFVTSQFRILYSYLCSALYRSRFSRGAQLGTFVFHYWGRGCSFLRLRGGLLWSIVGITANREWNVNMADKREGKQNLIGPSPIWYGILPQHRKLYPALSPRRRRMTLVSRSRTVFSGNGRNHIGTHTDLHKLHPSPFPI